MQGAKVEDSHAPMDGLIANGDSGTSAAPVIDAAGSNDDARQQIEEDPENEFTGGMRYEAGMPRIINVGIDGPGTGYMPLVADYLLA